MEPRYIYMGCFHISSMQPEKIYFKAKVISILNFAITFGMIAYFLLLSSSFPQVSFALPIFVVVPLLIVWGIFKKTKASFALSLSLSISQFLFFGVFFFFPYLISIFSRAKVFFAIDYFILVWFLMLVAQFVLIFFSKQNFGLSKLGDLKLSDLKLAGLGLLLFIVCGFLFSVGFIIIDSGQSTNPLMYAADLVKDLINKPYAGKTSSQVTFKSGDSINTQVISAASQAGVTEQNIVLSLGDFQTTGGFTSVSGGASISYTGGSSKNVRLWAMCAPNNELVQTVHDANVFQNPPQEMCSNLNTSQDTCCLIALRKIK